MVERHSPVVEIAKLSHFFGKGELRKQTLFEIDLSLYPGEIVLMTGPSGSGKTTLLTLIGGLRSPQQGSLRVFNNELFGAKKRQLIEIRRKIGYIFQGHNLLDCLTARQNVEMSLKLHRLPAKVAKAKAIAMLEAVGLAERVDYHPPQLSVGQKQRVAIARALVSHPKIVLADEPTAALDSKSGRAIVEILQRLAKEQGCTILLVTHDNRILDTADRIVHLEDGKILESSEFARSQLGVG